MREGLPPLLGEGDERGRGREKNKIKVYLCLQRFDY
jgi:hypothetical protein